jgi:hypothetical protein
MSAVAEEIGAGSLRRPAHAQQLELHLTIGRVDARVPVVSMEVAGTRRRSER